MTPKRKQFSKQFKIDAVKLVTEQGYKVSEAAPETLASTIVLWNLCGIYGTLVQGVHSVCFRFRVNKADKLLSS